MRRVLLAVLVLAGSARAQDVPDKPPEDVPADNRFDPGRMQSTLVVPRTAVSRFRFPAIDVHSHDYAETPAAVAEWVKLQEKVGIAQTFVLTGETGDAFEALVAKYAKAYPGRFVMFSGFTTEGIEAPDYGERLRAGLRADVAAGAHGMGELSDKGLGLVRVGDKAYFLDDPRFDPLWDEAGRLHVPVFVHVAEPAAFYEPPDEKNDLRRSANWSLHGKGTPGFKAMLEKFERVLSKHPGTRFVAVHSFNLTNDLGAIAELLRRHPNVDVDFAARMWELGRQPFTARKFFLAHADRILFGTDNDPTPAMYLAHLRQMETQDEWFWPADAEWWRAYGMDLPDAVLKKVYRENALELIGRRR